MRGGFSFLIMLVISSLLEAREAVLTDSKITEQGVLTIKGAADYPEIAPLLAEFGRKYPHIKVDYEEFSTRILYQNFLKGAFIKADLITSSAMDLQIKLINDGYAQSYRSKETSALPSWASWRNEIFGFTYEPAVIAYNHDFLTRNSSILTPNISSRENMLEYIRQNTERMQGKIGTFDIEKVGVGYLLWSHDSQQTSSYGRILESFGIHNVRLFPSSAVMLKALAEGEIAMAYNVLGSYANSWAKAYPKIKVVMPTDYTMAIMRTAFIPKTAPNPNAAKTFLDFLLSREGQQILADHSSLFPIREDLKAQKMSKRLGVSDHGQIRAIPLGLRLLVLTDEMKRQLLLNEWNSALIK